MPRRARASPTSTSIHDPPPSSTRARATQQTRRAMRRVEAHADDPRPGLARAALDTFHKAPARIRRLWKQAQRCGSLLAHASGIETLVRGILGRLPGRLGAGLAVPQVADAQQGPDGRSPSTVKSRTSARRPLRVRFRSPPHHILGTSLRRTPTSVLRVSQSSPYRVRKPYTRTMEQQRLRDNLASNLSNSQLSEPWWSPTRKLYRETKSAIGWGDIQVKKRPSRKSEDPQSTQAMDEPSRPATAPHAKTRRSSAPQADLSSDLHGLKLADVPSGVPDGPRKRSSTRLVSRSKLIDEPERPRQEPLKTLKGGRVPSAAKPAKADDEDDDADEGVLAGSIRRKNARAEERRREAEAQRQAQLQREAEERRARERAAEDARRAQEAAARAFEAQRRGTGAVPKMGIITPLSHMHHTRIEHALDQPPDHVLVAAPVELRRRDLGTLLPQPGTADRGDGWLNDSIIAAALKQAVAHGLARTGGAPKPGAVPRFHAFATHFFSTFRDKGYAAVKRWTKRAGVAGARLLECELVLVPVHSAAHWTLLALHPRRRRIEYYDSLNGAAGAFFKGIRAWLAAELGPEHWREAEWTAHVGESPQQDNMRDCGVFLVTNAKMLLLGWQPRAAFGARDIPTQRLRLAAELLAGGYEDDLAPPEPAGRWATEGSS